MYYLSNQKTHLCLRIHDFQYIIAFNQGSDTSSADSGRSPPRVLPAPSSRQLQRRLEARIEHAKRLHQEYHTTPSLIPIQRLPIPGAKDHQPLVQWDSDDRYFFSFNK